jgi:hypothetical protein
MMTESDDFDLHKRIKRQRTEDLVEFVGVLNLEDADIRVFPSDPPQMRPLLLQLQLLCPLMLVATQFLKSLRGEIVWNADINTYVKEHIAS